MAAGESCIRQDTTAAEQNSKRQLLPSFRVQVAKDFDPNPGSYGKEVHRQEIRKEVVELRIDNAVPSERFKK